MTKLSLAISLPGEKEQLTHVLEDLADHDRKRVYADWLSDHDDPRGAFLHQVLDQWNAGKGKMPSRDDLSLVWQRTSGLTLLQKMREQKLDSIASIFSVGRPALLINLEEANNQLPVGSCKFGGCPDLPANNRWPQYKNQLHTFVGQINLSEIADTQAAMELPATGLLSFFVFDDPIETGQPGAEGAKGAWNVIYSPDLSNLQRLQPPQEFDEGNSLAPECQLEFEETLDLPYVDVFSLDDDDYAQQSTGCLRAQELGLTKKHDGFFGELQEALMPNRQIRTHLLGWSHPNVLGDDPLDKTHRNLLTVASEELCDWCWADDHQIFFGIRPTDLAQANFNNTSFTDG